MKNNLLTLNEKCILNDHVLLTLFKNFKSDKSIKNRDRLNRGEKLTIDELKDLPYSEFVWSSVWMVNQCFQ